MPLSEYEQRVLAQMEQQLRDADPELAESLEAPARGRIDVRRLSLGILVALVGIGALVVAVATDLIWLGILGFVAMLAGALLATTLGAEGRKKRGSTAGPKKPAAPRERPAAPGGGSQFMDRQQERWERRQENS